MRQGIFWPCAICCISLATTLKGTAASVERAALPRRCAIDATLEALGFTELGASGYRCCVSSASRPPSCAATVLVQVAMDPAAAEPVSTAAGVLAWIALA